MLSVFVLCIFVRFLKRFSSAGHSGESYGWCSALFSVSGVGLLKASKSPEYIVPGSRRRVEAQGVCFCGPCRASEGTCHGQYGTGAACRSQTPARERASILTLDACLVPHLCGSQTLRSRIGRDRRPGFLGCCVVRTGEAGTADVMKIRRKSACRTCSVFFRLSPVLAGSLRVI